MVATSTTKAEYVAAASCYLLTKGFDARRHVKRGRDTKIPQSSGPPAKVGDEAVHKELGDRMERAATTASSLEAEQDSGSGPRTLIITSSIMANLEFCDTHNMVTYLLKPEGSEDFQQIVDFLNTSHIKFALTKNPTIYTSLIQQFWQTASTSTLEDGEVEITATIYGQLNTITEASLRRHLKLEDADGISSLPNTKIFEQLALMGYASDSDKLTFQKGHFSPQWRFLIHTILHCLSPKRTAWEQFSSNIATAIIYLATNKSFNFSKMIFEGMLIMRVKKLEYKVKSRQPRRRARVVISNTKEDLEDPSKQGRRIAEIDQNPSILLVQDEGTSWIQEDAEGEKDFSTANIVVSTASATPEVSTAAENLVYIRRSAKKRKDKGKAIMKEDESVQKKEKKQLEQERRGHEEAIRLQEQINEEERQRIAMDAEIAKQLQEEFDRARQEQEVIAEVDQAHDIDWSDLAVLKYHALQNRSFSVAEVRKNMCMYLKNQGGYKQSHFKGMSYEDVRLIFKRVWDQNHVFVPKDFEIEKEVMKRPGFDFQQKSIKKNDKIKASGFVQKQPAEEEKEKKNDDSQQQAGSSKKRSREDSNEDNVKKQKLEDDDEKEELGDNMDVVPRDDIAIDVEADGSSKNYKIFSEMLDDFDRQDVMDLHRLVQERYDTTSPEGYDLLLWGDLKILFEPNEEDEIWKNQQDYNLISWRLFDSCGIHILLMHNGIAIHMMIEKKYPYSRNAFKDIK
ncbi:hypothetical protein Tco_0382223 [Tanacetum coccineum]